MGFYSIKLDPADLLLSKDYGSKRYLKKGKILFCYRCNKRFYKRPSQIKERNFCSKQCSSKGKRGKPKRGQFIICSNCKIRQYRRLSHIISKQHTQGRYFCSKVCMKGVDFGGKIELKCKCCGSKYKTYKSQIRHRGPSNYCSNKCRFEFQHMNFITKKRKKKTSNTILKKTLWQYFSQFIRQRDDGVCISCGKKDFWRKMDAGHYIPKTAGLSLYFDEQNVNCQCTYCNRWMHGNLSAYAIALRKKYGETILEELDAKRNKIMKIRDDEYIEMIEHYKELMKDL